MNRVSIICLACACVTGSARAAVVFSDDFTNNIASSRLTNDAFAGGTSTPNYWARTASSGGTLASNQAPGSSLLVVNTGNAGTTSVLSTFNRDAVDPAQDLFNADGGLRYSMRGIFTDTSRGSATSGNLANLLDFGILSSNSTHTNANDKVILRLRTVRDTATNLQAYTYVVGQTEQSATGGATDVLAGKTPTDIGFAPTGFDFDVTPSGYSLSFYNGSTVGFTTSAAWAAPMNAADWGNGSTVTGSLIRMQISRSAVASAAVADASATTSFDSLTVSTVPEPASGAVLAVGAGALLRRRRRTA